MLKLVALSAIFAAVYAQQAYPAQSRHNYALQNEITTPYPRNYYPPAPVHYVNIGAQLAGDYKFGYDTGKGPLGQSFREETRLPDGTVKGAYGIMDENGKQRIIRYVAGKDGFKVEGDIGPNGDAGVAPGPAPVAPAPHRAPAAQPAPAQYNHQPTPAQYNYQQPAPAQYNYQQPAPAQYAAPATVQYTNPAPQAQYPAVTTSRQARKYDDGQWDPKRDDPYYVEGPSFIDVDRLSYDIGTARQ